MSTPHPTIVSDLLLNREMAQISRGLLGRLEESSYEGWDPFDALNSKVFQAMPFSDMPLARLVWTQLFKRLPVNLRKITRVPKTANPVTIALSAEIYRRIGNETRAKDQLSRLLDLRVVQNSSGHCAWGYPFAWQSKAFFVPRNSPNVIAMAYAIRELSNWTGKGSVEVEDTIQNAAALIFNNFTKRSADGRHFIAYVPHSDAMVHNASVWGAFILVAGVQAGGPAIWAELADDAVRYTVSAQRPDGAWLYGEASHHNFVDGFHTGYVLEALHRIAKIVPAIESKDALQKGLSYYLANFIEPDGTAKYYSSNRYPIDANAAAQAVITMNALQAPINHLEKSRLVMGAAIRNLWLQDKGYFAYQRWPRRVVDIDYTRWTQIWLLLALAINFQNRVNPTQE
jgi:polysaccharide biosynthesis protein VpsJ